MQIVINIDEVIYKRILPYKDVPVISNLANDFPEITYAIANGVPLPKGHGRLIDENKIEIKSHIPLTEKDTTLEAIAKLHGISRDGRSDKELRKLIFEDMKKAW